MIDDAEQKRALVYDYTSEIIDEIVTLIVGQRFECFAKLHMF